MYEKIWVIISIFFIFVITKYLASHCCMIFDCYYKQNINCKPLLCVSIALLVVYNNKNFILNTDMLQAIYLDAIEKEECCIEKEFGAIGMRQTGCNHDGQTGHNNVSTWNVNVNLDIAKEGKENVIIHKEITLERLL